MASENPMTAFSRDVGLSELALTSVCQQCKAMKTVEKERKSELKWLIESKPVRKVQAVGVKGGAGKTRVGPQSGKAGTQLLGRTLILLLLLSPSLSSFEFCYLCRWLSATWELLDPSPLFPRRSGLTSLMWPPKWWLERASMRPLFQHWNIPSFLLTMLQLR